MLRIIAVLLLAFATCGGALAADPPNRKFVVYFQEWSADIDGAATDIVKQAATAAKATRGLVTVTGYADPTGSKRANALVSELRAQRVSDLMQEAGLSVSRIKPIGRGSVKFALSSQESRRVEVTIGAR